MNSQQQPQSFPDCGYCCILSMAGSYNAWNHGVGSTDHFLGSRMRPYEYLWVYNDSSYSHLQVVAAVVVGTVNRRFLAECLEDSKMFVIFADMNTKRKEKFADLLLDIAKYIITAVLLATWFSDVGSWEWYSYAIPVVVVVTITIGGLLLYKDDEKGKHKNK